MRVLQASAKLESVLQQQACEREEQQEQLQALYQQLADTQEQVALLQQVGGVSLTVKGLPRGLQLMCVWSPADQS
jgi:hypothetical protein